MKKVTSQLFLFLVVGILATCIYFNSNFYIRQHEWKHSGEGTFGAWMELKMPPQ